jgi:hypothetical protein
MGCNMHQDMHTHICHLANAAEVKGAHEGQEHTGEGEKASWLQGAMQLDAEAIKKELAWREEQESLDQLMAIGALTDQQV